MGISLVFRADGDLVEDQAPVVEHRGEQADLFAVLVLRAARDLCRPRPGGTSLHHGRDQQVPGPVRRVCDRVGARGSVSCCAVARASSQAPDGQVQGRLRRRPSPAATEWSWTVARAGTGVLAAHIQPGQ